MPGYLCDECEKTVPRARYCPNCNSSSIREISPSADYEDSNMSERFSDIALNAGHESVTFDRLRSKHDSYERPLGSYLQEDEQPEAICDIKKCTIEGVDGSSWKISAGVLDSGHTVITDERVIALFPRDENSQLIAVQFTDVVAVDKFSNWRSDVLSIKDIEGYEYEFVLDVDGETFETVADLVRDLNDAVDSEESRAVRFLNKIDTEIESAENAEGALYAIAELFENRSEETHFDQAVAEADSIEELVEGMAEAPGFETVQGELSESESETSLAKPTLNMGNLQQRISETARDADPKDVGKYSLGAVLGFGTAAVSAPISTTVGIAALLAGGAATGAYASTNPNSVAARIEPLQLAMNAKGRSSQIGSSSRAGGFGTGAALGTIEYLSQMDSNDVNEAYAKWLSEVDIDSVIEGQKTAARYARQSNEFDNPKQASILGGAAGLAYGYTDFDEDINQALDDDVVGEILEEKDSS